MKVEAPRLYDRRFNERRTRKQSFRATMRSLGLGAVARAARSLRR